MKKIFTVGRDESGMVLVLSLLSLASLTILGTMAIYNSTIETMISGNEKTAYVALMNAGAGVEHARRVLLSEYPWTGDPVLHEDVLKTGAYAGTLIVEAFNVTFNVNATGVDINSDGIVDYRVVVSDPMAGLDKQIKVLSVGYGPNNKSQRRVEAWLEFRPVDSDASYAMSGANEHNDAVYE
jgi:hypothetical protein